MGLRETAYMERVFNFSAGPSIMPEEVLRKAQSDILNYKGSGMSVMEMSHRTSAFQDIFDTAKENLKEVLSIPDTYEILFLQGGATLQFAAIPMNLIEGKSADYAITGNFANKAAIEAKKYGTINVAYTSAPDFKRIPKQEELVLSKDAKYFYYCANNTIYGTAWNYVPKTECPLVCDMSSEILSKPIDVSKYGLIYAGAQKNMAPAGLTVVIVDKKLLGNELQFTPQIMSYKVMVESDSMLNTPPCWCIYMLSLMLDWIKDNGGVEGMKTAKIERAKKIYEYLDNSSFFKGSAEKESRSDMNVTFTSPTSELDAIFVKEAEKYGIKSIKGHKIAGGMRASLYNAMPMEGVEALVKYMKEFELEHGKN